MTDKHTTATTPSHPWSLRDLALDLEGFVLRIFGAVDQALEIDWSTLSSMPAVSVDADLDATSVRSQVRTWRGASLVDVLESAGVSSDATCVTVYSEGGYSSHLRLYDLLDGDPVLALEVDGRPLSRSDGGPVRLVLPRLAPWRSAKWVRGLEVEELTTA